MGPSGQATDGRDLNEGRYPAAAAQWWEHGRAAARGRQKANTQPRKSFAQGDRRKVDAHDGLTPVCSAGKRGR